MGITFFENLNIILTHTNEKIIKVKENLGEKNSRSYKELSLNELKAVLRLLYLIGVQKQNHNDIDELWNPKFGSNLYRAVIGGKKFTFILNCLRFDN